MRMRFPLIAGVAISLIVTAAAVARLHAGQAAPAAGAHVILTPDQVKYAPIEIPGFASGVKIAAIHGDPNAESGMYVVRLQFPAGEIPRPLASERGKLDGSFRRVPPRDGRNGRCGQAHVLQARNVHVHSRQESALRWREGGDRDPAARSGAVQDRAGQTSQQDELGTQEFRGARADARLQAPRWTLGTGDRSRRSLTLRRT